MLESFFMSHWYLIFPVFGMIIGLCSIFLHFHHKNETLKVIKSYVDKGQEPPASLMEHLHNGGASQGNGTDMRTGQRGRYFKSSFILFALAAAFAYWTYNDQVPHVSFLVVLFGILGLGNLLLGLFYSKTKD